MERKIPSTIKDQELLAERRSALCKTAARLFRKNGYSNTTIQEIADESGISVGSIYRYINNKEDMMYLMLQDFSNLMDTEIYPLVKMSASPTEKLFTMMEKYYTLISQNSDYFHVSLRDMKLISGFRTALQKREDITIECFVRILQEGIDKGEFAPIPVDLFAYDILMFGHTWIVRSYRFWGKDIGSYIRQQRDIVERVLRVD